jgi:hypothetical protein
LPESPRFLEGQKRYSEANKVLRNIQKFNQGPNAFYSFDMSFQSEKDPEQAQGSLRDLINIPVYRLNLFVMMIIWSFGSFAFFMIPYYLKNVKADIY